MLKTMLTRCGGFHFCGQQAANPEKRMEERNELRN